MTADGMASLNCLADRVSNRLGTKFAGRRAVAR